MGFVVAGGKNLICDMICRAFSADSAKAALKSLPAAGKDALKRAAERGYESSGARLATHHAEKMASLETRKAAAEAGETVVKDAAKETLKGLKSAGGWLRRELGAKLQLRYTPELVWEEDQSITHGARIFDILATLDIPEDADDAE